MRKSHDHAGDSRKSSFVLVLLGILTVLLLAACGQGNGGPNDPDPDPDPDPVASKPSAETVLALEDELSFTYMAVATDDLEWDIEIEYDTTDVQAVFDHYASALQAAGFDQEDIEVDDDDEIEAEYTNTSTGVWVEIEVELEDGRVNVDLDIEDPRVHPDGSAIPAFSLTEFWDLEIPVYPGVDIRDVEWDFNFDHPTTGAQAVFDYYDQLLQDLGWTQTAIDDDDDDEWEVDYRFEGVHLELEVEQDDAGSEVELELNKLRFYQGQN